MQLNKEKWIFALTALLAGAMVYHVAVHRPRLLEPQPALTTVGPPAALVRRELPAPGDENELLQGARATPFMPVPPQPPVIVTALDTGVKPPVAPEQQAAARSAEPRTERTEPLYRFVGIVWHDGQQHALIESVGSADRRRVRPGEQLPDGCRVRSIGKQSIELISPSGTVQTLRDRETRTVLEFRTLSAL